MINDIQRRNVRIIMMYQRGIDRKRIAFRLCLAYETVKKVLQKRGECLAYRRLDVRGRSIALTLS